MALPARRHRIHPTSNRQTIARRRLNALRPGSLGRVPIEEPLIVREVSMPRTLNRDLENIAFETDLNVNEVLIRIAHKWVGEVRKNPERTQDLVH